MLAGLSWSTIAADLHNPNSPVAQAVDGTANYITAAICKMTGNQPASACTADRQVPGKQSEILSYAQGGERRLARYNLASGVGRVEQPGTACTAAAVKSPEAKLG